MYANVRSLNNAPENTVLLYADHISIKKIKNTCDRKRERACISSGILTFSKLSAQEENGIQLKCHEQMCTKQSLLALSVEMWILLIPP